MYQTITVATGSEPLRTDRGCRNGRTVGAVHSRIEVEEFWQGVYLPEGSGVAMSHHWNCDDALWTDGGERVC